MITALESLAFSMQANPGVFALLLGSGVSRAARVPTGWEVTLDLVRKLAVAQGDTAEPDPEAWYKTKYGKAPDYSVLLNGLAKTAPERQQLLKSYWEPTEAEKRDGSKQPTDAHRSIAWLAANGYVRVIVTTNFDRLLETALTEAGVVPTVISTADQIAGALPLVHERCVVIKLHGDYLDTRILNTPSELANYPPATRKLLARVVDEFGLVVCGWSAEWDPALRAALEGAASRRFSMYWCSVRAPTDSAAKLIQRRGASLIEIDGADSFFSKLKAQVEALALFSRPHPLSTEAAVVALKRYLSEPRYRIELQDLVLAEVRKVRKETVERFSVGSPSPTAPEIVQRVKAIDAACATIVPMGALAGYWADTEHGSFWKDALRELAAPGPDSGSQYETWLGLQRYPATLLLYSLCVGAIAKGRLAFVGDLLSTEIRRRFEDTKGAAAVLAPGKLCRNDVFQALDGMERRYVPLNDWIYNLLVKALETRLPNPLGFQEYFDKVEILIALACAFQEGRADPGYWAPVGAYGYRSEARSRIIKGIRDSVSALGDASPYVTSRIFGHTPGDCLTALAAFEGFAARLPWGG